MKWIKLFENFENISSDIKDILIDIIDDNPNSINRGSSNVTINSREIGGGYNRIVIMISTEDKINLSKYKDEILRLDEYLEKKGYVFSSFSYYGNSGIIYPKIVYHIKGRELFNKLLDIGPTRLINIYYK